jgi:hypothetical protein
MIQVYSDNSQHIDEQTCKLQFSKFLAFPIGLNYTNVGLGFYKNQNYSPSTSLSLAVEEHG